MERMKEAGLEPLAKDDGGSAMWLHNILRIGSFHRRLRLCRRLFRERRPDLVVLVDFGGFNLFLARAATRAGIPVVYYVIPQVWAHGRYRLKKIAKWVTKALVIYPFEPDLCRRYGVDAEFVGHPLFDELERVPPDEGKVSALRDSLPGRIVGLFPGSRRQEIRANLPIMLCAAAKLREEFPDVRFAAVCPPKTRALVEKVLQGGGVEVALPDVRPLELARASEVCITKSGTITLEIASQHTPMVIFYRVSPLVHFLARGVTDAKFIGLVNTLEGRAVSPERAMRRDEPEWVTARARELLADSQYCAKCREDVKWSIEKIAAPGASERAAHVSVKVMQQAEARGSKARRTRPERARPEKAEKGGDHPASGDGGRAGGAPGSTP
jgi:lipid-A-disaccharide synthase